MLFKLTYARVSHGKFVEYTEAEYRFLDCSCFLNSPHFCHGKKTVCNSRKLRNDESATAACAIIAFSSGSINARED